MTFRDLKSVSGMFLGTWSDLKHVILIFGRIRRWLYGTFGTSSALDPEPTAARLVWVLVLKNQLIRNGCSGSGFNWLHNSSCLSHEMTGFRSACHWHEPGGTSWTPLSIDQRDNRRRTLDQSQNKLTLAWGIWLIWRLGSRDHWRYPYTICINHWN